MAVLAAAPVGRAPAVDTLVGTSAETFVQDEEGFVRLHANVRPENLLYHLATIETWVLGTPTCSGSVRIKKQNGFVVAPNLSTATLKLPKSICGVSTLTWKATYPPVPWPAGVYRPARAFPGNLFGEFGYIFAGAGPLVPPGTIVSPHSLYVGRSAKVSFSGGDPQFIKRTVEVNPIGIGLFGHKATVKKFLSGVLDCSASAKVPPGGWVVAPDLSSATLEIGKSLCGTSSMSWTATGPPIPWLVGVYRPAKPFPDDPNESGYIFEGIGPPVGPVPL